MKSIFCLSLFILLGLASSAQEIMLLKTSGKVVIGDTTQINTPGNYNLYVQNGILTERVKVALKSTMEWSDNSFDKTPTLKEVDEVIQTKSHLFGMPSADDLVTQGYELKAMDAKLLEQVEWLWQHMIKLEAENAKLKKQLDLLDLNK